jgi:hypothetical protein
LPQRKNTVEEKMGKEGRKEEGLAIYFIGAFTKLRQASISFFVCSTILPHGTTRLSLDRFSRFFYILLTVHHIVVLGKWPT